MRSERLVTCALALSLVSFGCTARQDEPANALPVQEAPAVESDAIDLSAFRFVQLESKPFDVVGTITLEFLKDWLERHLELDAFISDESVRGDRDGARITVDVEGGRVARVSLLLPAKHLQSETTAVKFLTLAHVLTGFERSVAALVIASAITSEQGHEAVVSNGWLVNAQRISTMPESVLVTYSRPSS